MQALEALRADLAADPVDRVVCLGDAIGYGADPLPCLDWVRESCAFSLMGNHEAGLLFHAEDFNERARAAIDWTRDQLNGADEDASVRGDRWDWLGSLEESVVDGSVMFAHGSPRDPVREYLLPSDARREEKMAALFDAMGDSMMCFVGHSHVPGVYAQGGGYLKPKGDRSTYRRSDERVLVNIGSVGQPRDGDPRLSYAVQDGDRIEFRRLEYDVEGACARIHETQGLPDELGDRLMSGR